MKIIITESQYKNIVENDIPLSLKRRFESIKLMIPSIIKYYDVDEYNKIDFIDEVLHQIYDEIDYRDINSFFDHYH